jgi:nicotinic acid mononucleotide adenylyltransferase
MAMEAYAKAFEPGGAPAVGLGLSASVASVAPHRGEHRVFVATVTETGCRAYAATLHKGAGPEARAHDGDLADALGLAALLVAAGREPSFDFVRELAGHEAHDVAAEAMRLFLARPYFLASGERRAAPSNGNGLALFPGAFHPPHDGHFWMARENDATFHVTIDPPHKPALSVTDVIQRAKLLHGFPRLFTAGDPLYLDKARRFPGAKFVIGADALARMLDPKWGVDPAVLVAELRQLGIRLLVADREMEGTLLTLDGIASAPMDLCERVLGPARHLTMSSTQIRAAMAARGGVV